MSWSKKLIVGIIVSSCVVANAGINLMPPKEKNKTTYIDITDDWQFISATDGYGWDRFYQDKTVYLGESFGWSVEYVSPDQEIEFVEIVELAGPALWDLTPPNEKASAVILSERSEVFNEGKVLKTYSLRKNTGETWGSYTVVDTDPEGEARITIRINDRIVRTYTWNIVPKPRDLPYQ